MTKAGSNQRKAWVVRNFWLVALLINMVLLTVLLVVLAIVLS